MMQGPGPRMEKSGMGLSAWRGPAGGRAAGGSNDPRGCLFVCARFAGAR